MENDDNKFHFNLISLLNSWFLFFFIFFPNSFQCFSICQYHPLDQPHHPLALLLRGKIFVEGVRTLFDVLLIKCKFFFNIVLLCETLSCLSFSHCLASPQRNAKNKPHLLLVKIKCKLFKKNKQKKVLSSLELWINQMDSGDVGL